MVRFKIAGFWRKGTALPERPGLARCKRVMGEPTSENKHQKGLTRKTDIIRSRTGPSGHPPRALGNDTEQGRQGACPAANNEMNEPLGHYTSLE